MEFMDFFGWVVFSCVVFSVVEIAYIWKKLNLLIPLCTIPILTLFVISITFGIMHCNSSNMLLGGISMISLWAGHLLWMNLELRLKVPAQIN